MNNRQEEAIQSPLEELNNQSKVPINVNVDMQFQLDDQDNANVVNILLNNTEAYEEERRKMIEAFEEEYEEERRRKREAFEKELREAFEEEMREELRDERRKRDANEKELREELREERRKREASEKNLRAIKEKIAAFEAKCVEIEENLKAEEEREAQEVIKENNKKWKIFSCEKKDVRKFKFGIPDGYLPYKLYIDRLLKQKNLIGETDIKSFQISNQFSEQLISDCGEEFEKEFSSILELNEELNDD